MTGSRDSLQPVETRWTRHQCSSQAGTIILYLNVNLELRLGSFELELETLMSTMQCRQMVSREMSNDDAASSLHLEHNWLPLALAPMSYPVETCPASLRLISGAQHL